MKKIVSLLIVSLAVFQTVTNIAYSAEDPSNAYKYTEAYNLQGEIITYNYDNLGRKIATFFPDGSKEIIEYFDGGGYALTKTNQQGQFVSRLEYDQQGLLVKAIDEYGYESISPPYAQGQADIATQFDLGPSLELPTIIVEAPYLYPNLPTYEDFLNQVYYISDQSTLVNVAWPGLGAGARFLQWLRTGGGRWVARTPAPGTTALVPTVFRERTRKYFRHNLMVLTGRAPPTSVHAHHVFPLKFGPNFKNVGININEPRFGTWLGQAKHTEIHVSGKYNDQWQAFFQNHRNPTLGQVLDRGRTLSIEHGFNLHY